MGQHVAATMFEIPLAPTRACTISDGTVSALTLHLLPCLCEKKLYLPSQSTPYPASTMCTIFASHSTPCPALYQWYGTCPLSPRPTLHLPCVRFLPLTPHLALLSTNGTEPALSVHALPCIYHVYDFCLSLHTLPFLYLPMVRNLPSQSTSYLVTFIGSIFAFHSSTSGTEPALSVHVLPYLYQRERLVGLVVTASASRAADLEFGSRLRRNCSGSSHASDLKIGTQWLPCQAFGVIGSALGLISLVSVYCDWMR